MKPPTLLSDLGRVRLRKHCPACGQIDVISFDPTPRSIVEDDDAVLEAGPCPTCHHQALPLEMDAIKFAEELSKEGPIDDVTFVSWLSGHDVTKRDTVFRIGRATVSRVRMYVR